MGDQVKCHQAVEAAGATRWDRTLDILKKVAAAVGSSLEIGEIFRETCQEAKEFFDSSHSAVVIFDAGAEHGLVEAEFPSHIGAVGRKLPIGREIKDRLMKSQTPIVIENVAEELPEGELRDILLGFDIQSLLAAPMTSRGRL